MCSYIIYLYKQNAIEASENTNAIYNIVLKINIKKS